ncbi:MAG: MBL fold metallo-hydrolase [Clostridiales bacterium]|nr:MBL fold metallo-hydrolase [Clostridiales bacterium]
MKLDRISERIWVYPFEEERDRPNLTYIKGDKWSLAVDAGHSDAHTREFYSALEKAGLPLPELTVLTHWHWDHTFGMHAVHGLTLANEQTNHYLLDFKTRLEKEGAGFFLAMHESVRREYADSKPVVVVPADMVFRGEMTLDTGNCPIRVFQAEAPHTDDSTLVWLPEERFLIMGDCTGGTFPDWDFDQPLADKLAATIQELNPITCLPGHWTPLSQEIIVKELLEGEG